MDKLLPPRGRFRSHRVLRDNRSWLAHLYERAGVKFQGWMPMSEEWTPNLVLYQWGAIVCPLLTQGLNNYRISAMYIEFADVASPGDEVSVPTYDRTQPSGIDYYNSLATNPNRDYLRVPITAATIESSDPTLYPDGNLMTFFAQTQGTVGVQGKPFGEAYNSTVIGGALVAEINPQDATQDLILSRAYFAPNMQIPKLNTGQVGMEWQLELQ